MLGKLIKYVGISNILWGTDSIWYGSPQDQIQAFRAFQISEAFQEQYGYPELTQEHKKLIFGLNATKPYGVDVEEVRKFTNNDKMAHAKQDERYFETAHFKTYGPKTRREFMNLKQWETEV